MSSLPSSWAVAPLSELCTRIVDGSHNPPAGSETGKPMLSARNINDFTIDFDSARLLDEASFAAEDARTQIQAGDVLLTIVGSIGRVAVVPGSAPSFTLQRSVAVLKPTCIGARYLAHALATPRLQQWLSENAKGTAQKGVYLKTLGSAELPIAPAAEQTRIVAKLEELLSDLDAGVAELKAAQAKLQHYRQSLLKAAVEGAMTQAWREANPTPEETGADLLARILRERRARWEAQQVAKFEAQGKAPPKAWQAKYPEPVQPELDGLPALPATWIWASLDMLGDIASGVAKGTKRDEATPVREVPYLRVANVQRGFLDLSEVKTILATERDIAALKLQVGDVLFNEGGDRDKLGRGWVWREEVPECIHQNHVFRMRPFIAQINSEFVSHHGNTFGKQWFQSAGKQTTNLASINMGMLRAFPVPVPPAEEQQAIVTQLVSQLERSAQQEAAVEKAMQQSAAQRQNLLRSAFAGQLVPQDPADEPATELLARIRAERAAAQPAAKRSRSKKVTA